MAPVVVFPDAVDVVTGYLSDALATRGVDVPVRNRVPSSRPSPFVLIRRLGGVRRDLVSDAPLVGYECWDATPKAAAALAQLVRALLFAMRGTVHDGVAVYRVNESGGPSDLPDPLSDHPRYVGSMEIAMRGASE